MPKETFFRLPSEKQKRLLEAAEAEFSRASLQEASIANIVKLADISRGSFYQYFEDKEDLYYYYFDTLRQGSTEEFTELLKFYKGDLFLAFEDYSADLIEEVLNGTHASFYRNLFMFMDFHGTSRFSPEFERQESLIFRDKERRTTHVARADSIMSLIDTDHLYLKDSLELLMLLKLLFSMFFSSVNLAYKFEQRGKEVDSEKIKKDFQIKVNWLKYGVYKKRDEVEKWEK